MSSRRSYPPIGLDAEMPFGKYKGEPLWWVIEADAAYVDWCLENVDGFALNDEAWAKLKQS